MPLVLPRQCDQSSVTATGEYSLLVAIAETGYAEVAHRPLESDGSQRVAIPIQKDHQ